MLQVVNKHRKVVCVDFDGVILRNSTVTNKVGDRIQSYVQRALRTNDTVVAKKVNNYVYNKYGHTLLGLQTIIGTKDAGSLSDFNNYVYDVDITREDYYAVKRDLVQWESFLQNMKCMGIPVYIFSNAPRDWCATFIEPSTINGFVWDFVDNNFEDMLKPNKKIYDIVTSQFRDLNIYFIDDKPNNLQNIEYNWVKILYDDNLVCDWMMFNSASFVAKDLNSCGYIITCRDNAQLHTD